MLLHKSVDFRTVFKKDLDQIKWVVDRADPGGEGGRLEWIDESPTTGTETAQDEEEGEGDEGMEE